MDAAAMTLIDEMQGTYLVASGACFRLWFEGRMYGPDDVVVGSRSEYRDLEAWEYVTEHLTRRIGANRDKWPLAARRFLADARAYEITASLDGRFVAMPARGRRSGERAA